MCHGNAARYIFFVIYLQVFRKKIPLPFVNRSALFKFTDIDTARKTKEQIAETYIDDCKYKTACNILYEGFEDAFQYITSGERNSRLRSTNLLERLNEELRRREKIVRIFSNVSSANRLIGALLMDQSEQWKYAARTYIKM